MIWYHHTVGAVVVVRPDGYVGTVVPLGNLLISILCRIHVAEMSAAPHTARVFRSTARKKGGNCNRDDVLADVS